MEKTYPKTHVMMIMGLNMLSFVIGLALVGGPFLRLLLRGSSNIALNVSIPGAYDTTIHVAIGALIVVLATFRIALAYGAIWIDIVLAALGVLTLMLPTFLHMRYNRNYNLGHLAGGGIVIAVAAISLLATLAVLKKVRR